MLFMKEPQYIKRTQDFSADINLFFLCFEQILFNLLTLPLDYELLSEHGNHSLEHELVALKVSHFMLQVKIIK